ncbi:hypothetical protein [Mesorhizobium sp.]|uniref:hypothetical protein n=1 Tax=Mesorhizobium sp. TaxID=1871066 RepID=UPI002600FC9A|nr:hypothetical protein [Mesorhizobium sp.]
MFRSGTLNILKLLKMFACSIAIVLKLAVIVCAEDGIQLNLDRTSPALHMPAGKRVVLATPAFEDYTEMFFDLCDAMQLAVKDECRIYPMNAEIGLNAIAIIQDDNRIIVFDRRLSPMVGYAGAMMIIGHELGHHYCHHLGRRPSPGLELEADRFAGASMRKAGQSLDDALAAIPILDERPSKSHPGRAERVAAITAGWKHPETGKSCRR